MKRAGLFGGTFNPVHYGHLRVAIEVMEGFGLDQVHFIPAANPPHKGKEGLAEDTDRFEMLSLAIEGEPGFFVSDVEMKRPGRSYTIDTVRQLVRNFPAPTECFLIIGRDAFLEIETWKAFGDLFETISFIVMSRPDDMAVTRDSSFSGIGAYIRKNVSSSYVFEKTQNRFVHEALKPVYLFPVTALDVSATAIRRIVRQGRSIRYLVPEPVASYIHKKGLYA